MGEAGVWQEHAEERSSLGTYTGRRGAKRVCMGTEGGVSDVAGRGVAGRMEGSAVSVR